MIINGVPGILLNANDRGLTYGDGVFRTMLVQKGRINHWQQHYKKLQHDSNVIGIDCPSIHLLANELAHEIQMQAEGVAKIIITRGAASRGYAPPIQPVVTRILNINPFPNYPDSHANSGVRVHVCQIRLGHQARLAGIKHLNRLENVLAAAEWTDIEIAEGILMDEDDQIIEGTRSNLFLVKDGVLYTPDLSLCGVAGLQRERVMEWARQGGVECNVVNLFMDDLLASDEAFFVNSIIGLWPIRELPGFRRNLFPISHQIQDWLKHESD